MSISKIGYACICPSNRIDQNNLMDFEGSNPPFSTLMIKKHDIHNIRERTLIFYFNETD